MSEKARVGQPIQDILTTGFFNETLETNRIRKTGGLGNPQTTGGAASRNAGMVFIQNSGEDDCPQFGCLGVADALISKDDNEPEYLSRPMLSCVTPTADHAGRFVIAQQPIAAGKCGWACISGITIAKVAMQSAGDTTAGVGTTADNLVSGGVGATILQFYGTAGGDPDYATVLMGASGVAAGFWARLGGSSLISGQANKWSYTFAAVKYQTANTWTDITDGTSGTAFNSLEAPNGASGTQGNGISNLPDGFDLLPIGAGGVVWIRQVTDCTDFSSDYIFQAINQVGGDCV